jgi:hypothetical protein
MDKKTETLYEIVEKFLDEHITADSIEENSQGFLIFQA